MRRRWMRMARARLWLAATGRRVILYTVDLMGIITGWWFQTFGLFSISYMG